MTRLSGVAYSALAWLVTANPVAAAAPGCHDLVPKAPSEPMTMRALEPVDLVRLRDMGSLPDFMGEPIFALSPDRTMLAFQLRQADPNANGYCIGMFVMSARAGARPVMVDSGGEMIRWRFADLPGKADFPSGFAKVITPRWFPDGLSIAFLKRDGPVTQIWRAYVDGRGSAALTQSKIDILDFRVTSDGRTIVYSAKPTLARAWASMAKEGRSGFHYDDRFLPNASNGPFPAPPIGTEQFAIDLETGAVRPASEAEAAILSRQAPGAPDGALAFARTPSGRRAWTKAISGASFPPKTQLVAEDEAGRQRVCMAEACRSAPPALFWSPDGTSIRFLRREGWGRSATAIYEWSPGRAMPQRLYSTQDLLVDCQPFKDGLLCAREGSTTPRYLSLIDLENGKASLLFDPNPEFQRRKRGQVERLEWKSAFDIESFGDLVYPVGYRPGTRYPLIVVQYGTRGFLRGGTGDEYPIQAFANRGFAVLSVERPTSPARAVAAKSYADQDKADLVDFLDRRNVLSSIEIAVQYLIDRGLADPQRIGITGLSDGASTVQYAGLNSSYFAAASMSGCCWEKAQLALLGPAVARQFIAMGWPRFMEAAPDFWSQISWAQNPERVGFPVLMQLSDSEFRSALAPYTALKEVGAAVDIFVFPGEPHVKWQPAHRLAIYARNLDWFDFWLRDVRPIAPDRAKEVAQWVDMKAQWAIKWGAASVKPHHSSTPPP